MENKKMTKRDYFTALLEIEEVKSNDAMVEFIEHELELLAKKNSSERKPTAVQKENADLKVAIAHCESVGDFGSRELLEDILESEEEHIDWLETQLGLIDKVSLENYLQSQMHDDE